MKLEPKDSVSEQDFYLAVKSCGTCLKCRKPILVKDLDNWGVTCDTCYLKVN